MGTNEEISHVQRQFSLKRANQPARCHISFSQNAAPEHDAQTVNGCLHGMLGQAKPVAAMGDNMFCASQAEPLPPGVVLAAARNGRVMYEPVPAQIVSKPA